MSEHEAEPGGELEDEIAAAMGEDDEQPGGETEGEPEGETADLEARAAEAAVTNGPVEGPPLRTDKEIEAIFKKLEKHREVNANRIGAILAEDAQALIPCPACSHFTPGMVYPGAGANLEREQVEAIKKYIGLPDEGTFKTHPEYEICGSCGGRGEILTGSLVPNHMLAGCPACGTKGYVTPRGISYPTQTPETVAPVAYEAPQAPSELPPEAQRLRELGYMVVPPIAVTVPSS